MKRYPNQPANLPYTNPYDENITIDFNKLASLLYADPYDENITNILKEFMDGVLNSDLTFERSVEDRLFFMFDRPSVLVKMGENYAISSNILGSDEKIMLIVEQRKAPDMKKMQKLSLISPNFAHTLGNFVTKPSIYLSNEIMAWFSGELGESVRGGGEELRGSVRSRGGSEELGGNVRSRGGSEEIRGNEKFRNSASHFLFQKLLPNSETLISYLSTHIFDPEVILSLVSQLALSFIKSKDIYGTVPISIGLDNLIVSPVEPQWIKYHDGLFLNDKGVHLSIIGDTSLTSKNFNLDELVNLILNLATTSKDDIVKNIYKVGTVTNVKDFVRMVGLHFNENEFLRGEGEVKGERGKSGESESGAGKIGKEKSGKGVVVNKESNAAVVKKEGNAPENITSKLNSLYEFAISTAKVIKDKNMRPYVRTSSFYDFVNSLRRLNLLYKWWNYIDHDASNNPEFIALGQFLATNFREHGLVKRAESMVNPNDAREYAILTVSNSDIISLCSPTIKVAIIGGGKRKYSFVDINMSITVDKEEKSNPDVVANPNQSIFAKCKTYDKVYIIYREWMIYDKSFFANIARLLRKGGSLYIPWPAHMNNAEKKIYKTVELYAESAGLMYNSFDGERFSRFVRKE